MLIVPFIPYVPFVPFSDPRAMILRRNGVAAAVGERPRIARKATSTTPRRVLCSAIVLD